MNWRTAYESFCAEVEDVPLFAQAWYLDAVSFAGSWAAAVVLEGDRCVAVLPYFVKQKWGFTYTTQPLFAKYMGPLLAPDKRRLKDEFRYYQKLIDQLPVLDGYTLEASPQMTNWMPFYQAGFRQTSRYTYVLNLQNEPAVEDGFNRNIRRNLRKADAQLTLSTDEDLATLWRLNVLSFQRQGLQPPYTYPQLEQHYHSLCQHDAVQLLFALDGQKQVHSAACLIRDRQRTYYHLSGDDPDFRESGSGIWLTYQAIRYARDIWRMPVFDFAGSMLPAVESVRRQFGARQQAYFRIWKTNSKWFRLLSSLKK